MYSTCVFTFLALLVGLAHSFSWDIVVGEDSRLKFYYNRRLTHIEEIPRPRLIKSVTYDPVHYRVLFSDESKWNMSISSFDLSTRKIQPVLTRDLKGYYARVVYDPVTQLLFWKEDDKIYSRSLKPASSNEAVDGNLLLTLEHVCRDIAVDSCGGYIYWITDYEIERAQFDGSEREILIQSKVYERRSIGIDQKTQKMYWTETIDEDDGYHQYTRCADFNGKSKRTLYSVKNEIFANSLTVSNDFIYWRGFHQTGIWKLPKNPQIYEKAKLISNSYQDCLYCQVIAANYSITEQTQGIPNCEALKNLTQNNSEPESTGVSLLCVHGTEVSGESRCECTQGYTGERCEVSLCHNYCLQGNCSVSAKGPPKCSCKTGYYGERCEVNACYMYCLNNGVCTLNEEHEPVCQCTAAYEGERCDASICKDYCLQGNCSVNTEGPTCRCNAGYSGERCEVNVCNEHCLNNGDCFLNDDDEAVCQCTADYEGERCDVATIHTGFHGDIMTQQILQDLRSEMKQVIREELQCTLQVYSNKLDENAVKIQKCVKSMKDDLQNHNETTSNM